MMRNLKAQWTLLRTSMLTMLLMFAAFIPYCLLINQNGADGLSYIAFYRLMMLVLLPVLTFVYMLSINGTMLPTALGYGATRKQWYLGMLFSKLFQSVLYTLLMVCVFFPLAAGIFGETEPILWRMLVPLCCVTLAFSALGELLGYVGAAKGAKLMIILMIVTVVVALVGLAILAILLLDENGLAFNPYTMWIPIISLALGAVAQGCSWLAVRRLAAR